jgi:glycine/D-amino acid oxidase-like deaminating enzyme
MILKETSWKTKNNKSYPKLAENVEADVAIIGAGMAGIFSAYVLSKAGLSVVVLEKNENILQNATLRTTAFITKLIDSPFDESVNIYGKGNAELVWRSGQDAIELFSDIIKKENIDCEFKPVPIYTYAKDEKQFEKLTREYEAVKKSDFEATLHKSIRKSGDKLNFANYGFLEIPNQAMFHPLKFAQGLADAAESAGAKIFTNSEVAAIESKIVKTKDWQVQAKDILIATYSPFTNVGTRFRKGMYVSYVYELEIAKKLIPEGMYLDMDNPYHYFRIDSYEKFDRMIVGGEDHRMDIKINPEKNFNALEKYVKETLGDNPYKITRKWSGHILEPVDGLPLIGAIAPHTYVTTAFSGNGMTYSAISATIIRDMILKNKNPYIDLYDVKRTPSLKQLTTKGFDYIEEFFGGFVKNLFSSKH